MSLRRFFILSLCTGVVICSVVYTLVQTYRDFEHEKVSKTGYQKQISDLMINSLREPILQGSVVETNIRVQSFLKEQRQVVCVNIKSPISQTPWCHTENINSEHIFETKGAIYFDSEKTKTFAEVQITYDNSDLFRSWKRKLRDSLIINLFVALLVFPFILSWMSRLITNDLRTLTDECNPDHQGKQNSESIHIKEFAHVFDKIKEFIAASKFNAEAYAAGEVAKQVAHDIRSPLAAIRMAIESLNSVDEGTRKTMRSAFDRINDISNDLMNRMPAKGTSVVALEANEEIKVEYINDLIDAIVSEKRIQYRERSSITLEFNVGKGAHALFARVSAQRLKRVVSNLIDNSFEAINQSSGQIVVDLKSDSNCFLIEIKDNGRGIPASIIPQLMQKGRTFGKLNGNGLGLFDAKNAIQSWQGTINIESAEGQGTIVSMKLPLTKSPSWFPNNIHFSAVSTVVSIDDDVSIHDIWKTRFQHAMDNFDGFSFLAFSSTAEFISWRKDNPNLKNALYLVDFEFLNQSKSGLDIIEELSIASQSILVTSRYAEPVVALKAQALQVPILPKNLAGFIQFDVTA